MTGRHCGRGLLAAITACALVAIMAPRAWAQVDANERAFPQSKAAIEKTLKAMQGALAGRLPTLEGFATPDHPLERYERGYYQASMQVTPAPAGGSVVRVSVKVTAWYSDPVGSRSGYQLLNSNGRLEADLLDQLREQLAKVTSPANDQVAKTEEKVEAPANLHPPAAEKTVTSANIPSASPSTSSAASPAVSKTAPAVSSLATSAGPSAAAPPSAAPGKTPTVVNNNPASPFNRTLAAEDRTIPRPEVNTAPEKTDRQLQAEIESLEEILRNQAHPKNLVAVKKSGTPVVATASLSAKPIFLASAHDEFEMLEFNRDWVHVRISGISRGWIWRNSLEMPEGIPDTAPRSTPGLSAGELFRVTREEIAMFPGDWPALRGKNVKILSVERSDNDSKQTAPQDKLAYAKDLLEKDLLEKNYSEIRQTPQDLAGIVLIFDSADGGMIAATLATLQQWKAGSLSDAALWHNCFFDPPETFTASGSLGTQ
jgi:hypothetical protein